MRTLHKIICALLILYQLSLSYQAITSSATAGTETTCTGACYDISAGTCTQSIQSNCTEVFIDYFTSCSAQVQPVTPTFLSTSVLQGGKCRSYFTYSNPNSETLYIDEGGNNNNVDVAFTGSFPTEFPPGPSAHFSIVWDCDPLIDNEIKWHLTGITATVWDFDPLIDNEIKWHLTGLTATGTADDTTTGACCMPNALCQVVTNSECESQNGTYQGDFALCGDNLCYPPQDITPIRSCTVDNGDGTCKTYLGYNNPNPFTVYLVPGSDLNTLSLPVTEGQLPSEFAPGNHDLSFSIVWVCKEADNSSKVMEWQLTHNMVEFKAEDTCTGACCSSTEFVCDQMTSNQCQQESGIFHGLFTPCIENLCLISGTIAPIFDCKVDLGSGMCRSYWGYRNDNPYVVHVYPDPSANGFSPGDYDRGQIHDFFPGEYHREFYVDTDCTETLTWTIEGLDSTMNDTMCTGGCCNLTRCYHTTQQECEADSLHFAGYFVPCSTMPCGVPLPIDPMVSCTLNYGNDTCETFWGYTNNNPVPVSIPVGPYNEFIPEDEDRGQVTTFESGEHHSVFVNRRSCSSEPFLTWNVTLVYDYDNDQLIDTWNNVLDRSMYEPNPESGTIPRPIKRARSAPIVPPYIKRPLPTPATVGYHPKKASVRSCRAK